MARERLKLTWRRAPLRATTPPVIDIPPPVNTPCIRPAPPPPPPPPPRMPCALCVVNRFPHATHTGKRRATEHHGANGDFLKLGFLDDDVIARLPLPTRMTAAAVSKSWKRYLHNPLLQGGPFLLAHVSGGGFAAMDVATSSWAHLPPSCSWPAPACSSSTMVDGADGLVVITPGTTPTEECRGSVLVGNPLTNQWTEFAFPNSKHYPSPVVLFPDRASGCFSLLRADRLPDLYKSSTGTWRWAHVRRPLSWDEYSIYYADWYVAADRAEQAVYLLGYDKNQPHEGKLAIFSVPNKSWVWALITWPEGRIHPFGCLLLLLQPGGERRLCFVGLREAANTAGGTGGARLCIWQRLDDVWVLHAEYTDAEVSRDDHGCCCNGVDTIWFLVTLADGSSRRTLSFSFLDCSWRLLPSCSAPTHGNPVFTTLDTYPWKLCPDCSGASTTRTLKTPKRPVKSKRPRTDG